MRIATIIIAGVGLLAWGLLLIFSVLDLQNYGSFPADEKLMGIILLAVTLVGVLASVGLPILLRRFGHDRTALACALVLALLGGGPIVWVAPFLFDLVFLSHPVVVNAVVER